MATCETNGHLFGPQGACIMCGERMPHEQRSSKTNFALPEQAQAEIDRSHREIARLRAHIARWEKCCTGKHGSQAPCVSYGLPDEPAECPHCGGDKGHWEGCRAPVDHPGPSIVEAFSRSPRRAPEPPSEVDYEAAIKEAWCLIDPLSPFGQPGSYARGEYNGIKQALEYIREVVARQKRLAATKSAVHNTVCPVCNTVHDLPMCPDETSEVRK